MSAPGRLRRLQHGQIVAGLRLQPERHAGVFLRHHLVQEPPGLRGNALSPHFAAAPLAPLVDLLGVPAQAQLSHDAVERLPDVVLHGGGGFDELAVEHGGAGAAL